MINLRATFPGVAAFLIPWLEDEAVSDILINGLDESYVEKDGRLLPLVCPFNDRNQLMDFVHRILLPSGKSLDARRPVVDGSLVDGSRFHIVGPPVAPRGPIISIRKWPRFHVRTLKEFGPDPAVKELETSVHERKNLLVSGATGSGKTSLLNCMIGILPTSERLLILEETPEIRTEGLHAIRLLSREGDSEGNFGVDLHLLLKNALRMRPDRLILGECRGTESLVLLQAMNTGHQGALTSIHANSPLDALTRLESLVLQAAPNLPLSVCRQWISSSIHRVVHLGRDRRVRQILEISGLEGERYRHLPLF